MMGLEALAQLMDEQAPALVLYARQWSSVPEDIVQEAFIKLAGQYRPPPNPVGWLYRVVRNAAISSARAEQRRRKHESLRAARAPAWFLPESEANIDRQAATEALQALPIDEREVIVAHIWGGLTFEQIGELARVSTSTAHRMYGAGLARLRERLEMPCRRNPSIPN